MICKPGTMRITSFKRALNNCLRLLNKFTLNYTTFNVCMSECMRIYLLAYTSQNN